MIKIRNIYYMLTYAFRVLNEQGYKSVGTEDFENTSELFAAILIQGMKVQIKRGLNQEYVSKTEPLSSIRGKIDISESVKTRSYVKKQLICSYDDFSINSCFNQIIKATVTLLIHNVSNERRKELRKLLRFMNDVDIVDIHSITWKFKYNRNNQSYRMLIGVCYLVIKGLLQTQSDGTTKLMDFLDEQHMCRLYEKFILEYYRREFPQISANPEQVRWQLDDEEDAMLPKMQTDITLKSGEKILIIDAKYYMHSTQVQFNTHTLHSGNLYQLFTYVKNKEAELSEIPHEVSGMLLYAKTDEDIYPENKYRMSGNQIEVRTLDLNANFDEITNQLNVIAESYLGLNQGRTRNSFVI